MLRDHRVKVEELIGKSFLLILPSLISGKWPTIPRKLVLLLGLSSLLPLRGEQTGGNTVRFIHERRTYFLDVFIAFYETLCCMGFM